MPREFVKDGRQFITRCSKRTLSHLDVFSMLLLIDGCSRQEGIHPHLASRWNGFLDHGRDWIHCEAEYVYTPNEIGERRTTRANGGLAQFTSPSTTFWSEAHKETSESAICD